MVSTEGRKKKTMADTRNIKREVYHYSKNQLTKENREEQKNYKTQKHTNTMVVASPNYQ